jgi:cell division inhibitor SepF
MGALRKAGVWLGLVEDDDDRGYDDRSYRGYADDDYDDGDVDDAPVPPRARSAERAESLRAESIRAERAESLRAERAESLRAESLRADRAESLRSDTLRGERPTVRSITRPTSTVSYPSRDSLALTPRTAVADRVGSVEEDERRYQITTLHPTTYNEARTIGEHFRDGVPVIMNLTEMDEADAKRLVDFAAGLAFGLRGTIERVTNRVFLLSPANVQVTAEDKARIAEGGFFNQS